MVFLYLNYCRTAIVADVLIEARKRFEDFPCKSMAVGIIVLGIILLIFRMLLKKPSLSLVMTLFFTHIIWCLFENYGMGYLLVLELPASQREATQNFLNDINEYKLLVIVTILVIAFVISVLSIILIKSHSPAIFITLTGLACEGCIYRILYKLDITNIYMRGFVYMLIYVVLLWLYIVLPSMILAFMFTFLGSLMITCGLEVLYNFEWNFLEAICSSYQCLDANMNKETSIVAYLVTLFSFALGFGIQIPTILKLHKKKPPIKWLVFCESVVISLTNELLNEPLAFKKFQL